MTLEPEFWNDVVRRGLPRFRWLRRPVDTAVLDSGLKDGGLAKEWLKLRSSLQPGDEVWPFELHFRKYLGMRKGYVVLRDGRPIGGLVTLVS